MTNMSKREQGDSFNKAPDQVGRTDVGYENLAVKLIKWPDYKEFVYAMSKASVAVKGSIISDDDEPDEQMAMDMLKGGLNQALEWFNVVFECTGVSRGTTHQLVRTRKASFTQQSMRYADMGTFNARMPKAVKDSEGEYGKVSSEKYPLIHKIFDSYHLGIDVEADAPDVWNLSIELAREAYAWLADHDIPMQDARTVCPIGTETYIICQYPLDEFFRTYAYRACQMFYPETVALFRLMGKALVEKCPWLEPHIKIGCEKTSGGINGLPHKCTYQGWERVEGQCDFEWALEENRVFKSSKVKG